MFFEGLVDCVDQSSFEEKLPIIMEKWRSNDENTEALTGFCDWLLKNKVNVIRSTMLRSVREDAGLGCPPDAFYTNASECMNNVVKVKVHYKRLELPNFISKFRELCEEQEREVERAVIQRGKYLLASQYHHMEVSENKWFKMTQEQRIQHLKKLNDIPVARESLLSDDSGPSHSCAADISCDLSLLYRELAPLSINLRLPISAIDAISRKALDILSVDGGIIAAPGQPTARMVMSKTGKRPHLIVPKKNGGFACDDDCPQYKSAGLCSHIVAVAKHDSKIQSFVSSYGSTKRGPNLTKLAVSEMPKGRGKKGGKGPSKRRKTLSVENRYELNPHCNASSAPAVSVTTNSSISVTAPVSIFNAFMFSDSSPNSVTAQFQIYPSFLPSPAATPSPSYPLFPHYNYINQGGFCQYPSQCPFRVCFITGNISVCHGCKGKYHKEVGPPHDLCVQHEEWRTFTPSGSATPQSRFGNVYYHCNPPCIFAVNPSFEPSSVIVHSKLDRVHKEWLNVHFMLMLH